MPNTETTGPERPETHPSGCPCTACEAERARLEDALAVLRRAGALKA